MYCTIFLTFCRIVDHCSANSPELRGHLAVCHFVSRTFCTCVFHHLPFYMNSFRFYRIKQFLKKINLHIMYKVRIVIVSVQYYLATTLTSPRSTQSALDNSINCELSNSFIVNIFNYQSSTHCSNRLPVTQTP